MRISASEKQSRNWLIQITSHGWGSGERTERIEEIGGHALDAFGTELSGYVAAHEAYLPGEVDNRDTHAGIALHTAQGEAPGVAADVHQVVDGAREDEVERGIERVVAIIMVEGKPAIPHVVGQLGESLVDGGPIAQGGQAGGAPRAKPLRDGTCRDSSPRG